MKKTIDKPIDRTQAITRIWKGSLNELRFVRKVTGEPMTGILARVISDEYRRVKKIKGEK